MTAIKTFGRSDSPYLFRASAFPAIIPWGTRFVLKCRSASYAASCLSSAELMAYSLEQFRALNDMVAMRFDRQSNGVLKYFESHDALQKEVAATRELSATGLEFQVLDADQMIALEPSLALHRARIAGGLFFPKDESGDANAFARALVEAFVARGGTLLTGATVETLDRQDDRLCGITTSMGRLRADHYVLCSGAMAPELGRQCGLNLPIYPVKGYSVTIETDGSIPLPQVPFLDWGRKICVTRFGNRIRAAGTAEFCGIDTQLTPARLENLYRNLIELFPALAQAGPVRHWAGLRPVTPDGLPILGATPVRNLFLNVGHGPQGWGLSCGTAAIVADVMCGQTPSVPLPPIAYGRS